jgi:cell wall-associated NlpC family hydrolase
MALETQEIFEAALEAGFTPDQAVTMTAIALAESSGNPAGPESPVTNDERSSGLWQINLVSHRTTVEENGWDLTDPVDNARAAFMVSQGGTTINPWTVTHADKGARYLDPEFVQKAEAAAASSGYPNMRVTTAEVNGYRGVDVPASASAEQAAGGELSAVTNSFDGADVDDRVGSFGEMSEEALRAVAQQDDGVPVGEFLRNALGQEGDRYVYGADPDPNDPNPDAFDCAELVQWSLERLGAPNPGGSTNEQQHWLRNEANGAIQIPVELAREIPGAVIYSVSSSRAADGRYAGHVGISLGNGETIEARGRDWGVGSWEMGNRFETAFLLPGVDYTDLGGLDDAEFMDRSAGLRLAESNLGSVDSDRDMLADHYEVMYGLDPANPDMDGDGITDGYELMVLGTDAMNPDSDYDGLRDDVERVLGFDPTQYDNPDLEAESTLAPEDWLDSDGDGIVNWAEEMMGFDPDDADTDDDGIHRQPRGDTARRTPT